MLPRSAWYPSGADLATRVAPVAPPAPPTFSITTCLPRVSDSRCASTRPLASTGPPAANGTTMVTGRAGQSSARAADNIVNRARATSASFDMIPPETAQQLRLGQARSSVLLGSTLHQERTLYGHSHRNCRP